MRARLIFILTLCMVVGASCILGIPFHESLDKGDPVPANSVLLIGKFTVDPMVEQGGIAVHAPRGTHKGVIKMNFADNSDQPLDKDSLFPFHPTELMDWSFTKTSFIPVSPGTRYARMGTLMLSSSVLSGWHTAGHAPTAGGVDVTYIMLYGDVKIVVPNNAKAVYIGTIVYHHDLEHTKPNKFGYPSKRVIVRDEYNKAMEELSAMKIPGITPRDVVKKLAVVVRAN